MAMSASRPFLTPTDLNAADGLPTTHPEIDTAKYHDMNSSLAHRDESQWPYYAGYRELDQISKEIRILTLLAGPSKAEISCTIAHECLSDAKPFVALSYCWGTADETAQIRIDDERVNIRKSLWSFLWHLRQLSGTLRVWVDFICIDQRNQAERNHQVKLMQDIFGTAVTVYAWLGDATPESEKAVDYIEQVFKTHHQTREGSRRPVSRSIGLHRVNAIFGREYWSRLWIIQEIVLAQDVQIMIGARFVPWKHLKGIYKRMSGNSGGYAQGKKTFAAIRRLDRPRRSPNSGRSLEKLVSDFHHARCQDPRDRMYGLLGMVSASVREQVVVDYEASVLSICLRNLGLLLPPKDINLFQVGSKFEDICGGRDQCLGELQRLAKDENLLSMLPRRMHFEKFACIRPLTYYTFAAKKRRDSQFSPFTNATRSEDFDIYISYVTAKELAKDTTSPYLQHILYSTCLPEEGAFVFEQSTSYLIARRCGASYSIVDIGAIVGYLCPLSEALVELDPNEWLEGKVPNTQVECALLQRPDKSEDGSIYFTGYIDLEMNGGALVEFLRARFTGPKRDSAPKDTFMISWDPTCLIDIPDPTAAAECSESFRSDVPADGNTNCSRIYDLGKVFPRLDELPFKATVPRVRAGSAADFFAAVYGMRT